MLEEEEDVDIDGVVEPVANGVVDHLRQNGEDDEDILWALDDPDDDVKGWKLKVISEDDDTMM